MKYLAIKSAGEIEPEALSLMGASTKRGDSSKIGMFGSGNKFALAFLIRSGLEPKIFSGTREIKVGKKDCTFRKQSFTKITIEGRETSLTTEMGKDWDCWMAIREIFANALDEGEATIEESDSIGGSSDQTCFFIPMNESVREFYDNIGMYFSRFRAPLHKCEHGELFPSNTRGVVYRKGIRVLERNKPSIFDYNFFKLNITEDRTIMYSFQADERMFDIISSLEDRQLINQYLANIANPEFHENNPSSVATISFRECPPVWDEVIRGSYFCPKEVGGFVKDSERGMTSFINSKVFSALEARFGKEILPPSLRGKGSYDYKLIEEGRHFREKINKAVLMFKLSGIEIDKYVIYVAEFSNKDILGAVDNNDNSIILSDRVMTMGQMQIAITILEEYLHLSAGVQDETRAFQDAALTLSVSMMEKLSGCNL